MPKKKLSKIKKAPKKASKKAKKPIIKAKPKKEGKLVGRVTHYFSDIKVGVIKVSSPIKSGDQVRIIGGENTDFNQKINSMQSDHKEIKTAKKGTSIGVKVKEKVREGYKVYKV